MLSNAKSHRFAASVGKAFVDNVAINFVMFGLRDGHLKVLFHQCPQTGSRALPGGLLHAEKRLNQSARKHLEYFTGSDRVYHEQLQVFDDRQFDSGSGVLRVVYYALLKPEQYQRAMDHSHCEPPWRSIDSAMSMGGEQENILQCALQSLRGKAKLEPLAVHLLPEKFTLTNFQEAFEAIFGMQFRKSNFRRKTSKMPFLVRCQERQKDVAHRAAEFYSFDKSLYHEACRSGFVYYI